MAYEIWHMAYEIERQAVTLSPAFFCVARNIEPLAQRSASLACSDLV
jgi:hypothetical protein